VDSRIDLQQPVLDGAIYSTNFFNGRLLSARDLTLEQSANREADRRLGRAVGEGVAYGLEVSKAPDSGTEAPAVRVEAGLAVNRRGEALALVARTDIALVRSSSAKGAAQIFSECQPLQTGAYVAGAGVYLLTIAPAQTSNGRAVTSAINPASTTCNTDMVVSAVQFRLIQIDSALTSAELKDEARLRNLVAYKCFGTQDTNSFIADPFGAEVEEWGLLDDLRPNQLTKCEVPLAILYWTDKDGVNFIDMWSVRRRIARNSLINKWSAVLDDRRAAEGEARFHQFVDEAIALAAGDQPESVVAKEHFNFLPAVGVIPLSTSSVDRFDYLTFFDGITYRPPVYLEGARVEKLVRDSWSYPPVDLASGEMFWLYWVRENAQAIIESPRVETCLIFSSGQMPFAALPRFDVAHWDFSNYI
jgi:hypothetical protein